MSTSLLRGSWDRYDALRERHDRLVERVAYLVGFYGERGAVPVAELDKALTDSREGGAR